METQNGTDTMEDSVAVSTNLNIILLYNAVAMPLRIYLTDLKVYPYKNAGECL